MALEQTLSIIKPNAIKKNVIGEIISAFEKANLRVAAAKMVRLTRVECEHFYAEHREKPFFERLMTFMTSGPVILLVLVGEDAITLSRKLMGPTDPAKAAPGTIRAKFGENVTVNAVHGSDSPASAAREISICFKQNEIVN
jgi:nucleoside-diphosphate kinase